MSQLIPPGRVCRTRPHHQQGVGLIEVMVAVLVVSIGFLGVAALQAYSLSTNNSAMARTMATTASYSILDAMRADVAAAESGAYNTKVTASGCPNGTTTLADTQLAQWCTELGNTLGAVTTTTGTIDCSNTGVCTITIQFDDSRSGGSDAQQVVTKAAL